MKFIYLFKINFLPYPFNFVFKQVSNEGII